MSPELHRSVAASSPHAEEGLSSESLILPLIIIQRWLIVKCLFTHAVAPIHWLLIVQVMVYSVISVAQFPSVHCGSTYCLSVSSVCLCSKFPSCTPTGKEIISQFL